MSYMNYDKAISTIFFNSDTNRFLISKYRKLIGKKYANIKTYLSHRFTDKECSYKESIYRIKFNIEIAPICPICGGEICITYKPKHLYRKYCSYECSNKSLEKIDKCKTTCLQKYNVVSTWQLEHSRKKAINKFSSSMSQQKRIETLRRHNSFNTSVPENESYKLLKEKYPETISQYKSDKYPFVCDFYIPEIDTYIECNYHWTHGKKPYTGSEEDRQIVEIWKAKNTKYYDNAINTWTVRDVNKRNVASKNNLNMIEFWNIDELKKWIISL